MGYTQARYGGGAGRLRSAGSLRPAQDRLRIFIVLRVSGLLIHVGNQTLYQTSYQTLCQTLYQTLFMSNQTLC